LGNGFARECQIGACHALAAFARGPTGEAPDCGAAIFGDHGDHAAARGLFCPIEREESDFLRIFGSGRGAHQHAARPSDT
jgi:hypothetical protein